MGLAQWYALFKQIVSVLKIMSSIPQSTCTCQACVPMTPAGQESWGGVWIVEDNCLPVSLSLSFSVTLRKYRNTFQNMQHIQNLCKQKYIQKYTDLEVVCIYIYVHMYIYTHTFTCRNRYIKVWLWKYICTQCIRKLKINYRTQRCLKK